MDPVQITVIAISFVLTILLVVLGLQVLAILKEMKITLFKINSMLDDAKKVTSTVSSSVTAITGAATGIKTALSFFNKYKKKQEKEE